MNLTGFKVEFLTAIGAVGAVIINLIGGWDTAVQTLLIFMAIDMVTGWTVAVFGSSPKTQSGGLHSTANFMGLAKKGVMLLLILMANQLDVVLGLEIVRTGAILSFTANEALSIVENAGLMGVPLPRPIVQALEILKNKEGGQ